MVILIENRVRVTHIYTRVRDFLCCCSFGRAYERENSGRKTCQGGEEGGRHLPEVVAPGFDGMPDRIVLLPGGRMGFVEVKAPGKRAGPLQGSRHELLRSLGFRVYVLDNPEQIGGIIDEIRTA